MISDKHQCLFVHVPKTAGQSIENFFLNLHGLTWQDRAPLLLKHNPDPALGPARLAHMTAPEYLTYNYLTPEQFESFFKFSFVRNPWDRLASEYRYMRYDQQFSFRDFVLHGFPEPDLYTNAHRHIIPQADYTHDEDGKLLVDFVGKFESLQADFDVVCSRLGLTESSLPHTNAAHGTRGFKKLLQRLFPKPPPVKKHYTSYYDEELIEVVGDLYARDIKLFGYRFDNNPQ